MSVIGSNPTSTHQNSEYWWMGVKGDPEYLLSTREIERRKADPRSWLRHARRRKSEVHAIERFDFALERAVEFKAVVFENEINQVRYARLISAGLDLDDVIAKMASSENILSIQARFTHRDAVEYKLRFR